jgi:hypothetical protein
MSANFEGGGSELEQTESALSKTISPDALEKRGPVSEVEKSLPPIPSSTGVMEEKLSSWTSPGKDGDVLSTAQSLAATSIGSPTEETQKNIDDIADSFLDAYDSETSVTKS